MKNSESLQALLKSEVSRRQFLIQAGTLLLAMTGLAAFIKNFGSAFNTKPSQASQMSGYGWSGYSGIPPVTSHTNSLRR